jgi:hypothetical protein
MEEYVEAELVFLLGKPWLGSYHLSRVSGEVYSMGWMAECDITLSLQIVQKDVQTRRRFLQQGFHEPAL